MHNFNEATTISTNGNGNGNGNQLTNNDDASLAATNNIDVIFAGTKRHESGPSSKNDNCKFTQHQYSNQFNSCRILQRKLELKVERAKKNFSLINENESLNVLNVAKSNNSLLIPINRLPIPGHKENITLVEYKSGESSDEDDISSPFFTSNKSSISNKSKKLDLNDTFSIQEMTIEDESDNDSEDFQNLELLPPSIRIKFFDKILSYVCCANREQLS